MTKRKSEEEKPAGKSKRRLPFTAAKDAATKALIVRNASCSPLLRLPLEIRDQIWASLLGDRLIHFEYIDKDSVGACSDDCLRPWHSTVCQHDGPEHEMRQGDINKEHSHSRCLIHTEFDYAVGDDTCHLKREQSFYQEMHLTALRVCRQIYSEANRVLWSTNTFSFHDVVTFYHFMDTRKTYQKRLLQKLRLQVKCVPDQEGPWSYVLDMKFIRSLVGLRSLRLQINHKMDAAGYQRIKALWDDSDWRTAIQMRLRFVQRLKVLPLTEVEVFIGDYSCERSNDKFMFTVEDRTEYADAIRRILLDPKGAESYVQDRKDLKEFHRQEREGTRESQALRAATQQKLIEFDAEWDWADSLWFI